MAENSQTWNQSGIMYLLTEGTQHLECSLLRNTKMENVQDKLGKATEPKSEALPAAFFFWCEFPHPGTSLPVTLDSNIT